MNSKLYAMLEQAIQDWVDASCDSDEWPCVIVGDRTVECMAKAARAVLDACEESQAYAIANGHIAEASGVTK